jgi:hypothetical protein
MAALTKSRRRHERHTVDRKAEASVEFTHAGRRLEFTMHNVSASGVSFAAREASDFDGLEPGLSLPGAVIRLDGCAIRGELLVMHVSGRGAGRICGALFYPGTDGDLVKLKGMIAGMHAARAE